MHQIDSIRAGLSIWSYGKGTASELLLPKGLYAKRRLGEVWETANYFAIGAWSSTLKPAFYMETIYIEAGSFI